MRTKYIQMSTATSGTVTLADTGDDIQLIHEAVSLAVTLTIALPANPQDGQTVYIQSVLGITTLTLSAVVGSIISTITTLSAAGTAGYMYKASTTKWYKI